MSASTTAPTSAASPARLPTVSVVIATYNRAHLLLDVLTPVLADAGTNEAVVVVDGSTDGSIELLQSLAARDRRVVAIWQDNAGPAAARAAAVSRASGDVVLFLDDDVVAAPGLVTGHAARHADQHRRVVVGYMPTRVPERRGPRQFTTRLYAEDYLNHVAGWERQPDTVLTHLWQGNVSLRRSDALAIYGMDDILPHGSYHEDQEFGLRAVRLGLVGVHDRDLQATHQHARTLAAFRRQARSQGEGTVVLHREAGDLLGPLSPTAWLDDLPAGLRTVLLAARRGLRGRALRGTLAGLVHVAGALRLVQLEMVTARLLRRLEAQAGADTASRSLGPEVIPTATGASSP